MESAKRIGVKFDDKGKMKVTRRAEIVIRFDVQDSEASQEYLNAIVGTIRKELKGYEDFANTTTEVEGNWL